MATFTSLPPEILLKVVSLLELHDVARIRQASKRLQEISQDRSVWDSLLAKLRLRFPVPPWFSSANTSSPSFSATDLEHAVLATYRVARAWPQPRPTPFKVQPRQGDMLLGLEMFLDRWLLVVYAEGSVYLWDTVSDQMAPPGASATNSRTKICGRLTDENENKLARWTSCAAQITDDGQKLIVLLNMRPTPKPYCRVYEVALKAHSSFKLLSIVRLSEPGIIRTISFHDNILLLSRGSAINLVDINAKPQRDIVVISPFSDDLEDMWNAAIEVRVFSRHVFVFKARSFEVHNMDTLLNTTQSEITTTPISQHLFQNTTFREIKVSRPTIAESDGEVLDIRFEVFAYDVLQGLFRYSVQFHLRPEQPPYFAVALPEIYPLTDQLASQYSRLLPDPDLLTPSPTPSNEARHAFRSVLNPSSRGFVSAYAIGSQGRRAVWVERVRGSTMREIHVWNRTDATEDLVIPSDPPREIERVPVFTIASPDLREDITRCALSESMGLIVLGNRAGELFFLDVDV
ncbi:hypothetical protein NP233_g7932 [Leucocoprinus birnbaumii]|uniref:F-box domain-containing protein n=1 Tax=Leucocoprinus birnbaumii TaxID=56174 RepID=A0AAD5YNJ7_9AGAR|nr:hypothetical protein NP233_g7932 [Leucocoprinus birnbaumii]